MTRRETFNRIPDLYDRARPGYPEALFDDLAGLIGLGPGCRVLEIGCGTGQATIPMAERGCHVTAIELGPDTAAFATRKLARFADVQVVNAAFESWPLPDEPFDVVLAATAFHWIDPAIRVVRAADALRPGGALVTLSNHHVQGDDGGFSIAVQDCYLRWVPGTKPGFRLPRPEDVRDDGEEIVGAGRFEAPIFLRHRWDRTHDSRGFVELLATFSDVLALDEEARSGLLGCISALIDGRFAGHVLKTNVAHARVARRLP
ncbi:MAG TPA: methyltransferase domain-containing protein [Candidatus Dormibacteraeota bacterium]|nr:methyltransferase domain-containing protein [Candidatus Dormibacteraeota bacterium]